MKIGFIGSGNMGAALATAACKSQGASAIVLANRTRAKAEALAATLGCSVDSNEGVAQSCDWIFLGVKPQMMADMLTTIQPILAARTTPFVLVTMAAGLTSARIQALSGGAYPVVRVMPNTPALIGKGILHYCGLGVTQAQLNTFAEIMAPAGLLDPISENLIDAASAISGCGPAFAYLFIEALADGGVSCGLPRDKAISYAAQMLQGSGALVLATGEHPGRLKDQVCSPAGSTIQGVRTLEQNGLRSATIEAVIAAFNRTKELGKT